MPILVSLCRRSRAVRKRDFRPMRAMPATQFDVYCREVCSNLVRKKRRLFLGRLRVCRVCACTSIALRAAHPHPTQACLASAKSAPRYTRIRHTVSSLTRKSTVVLLSASCFYLTSYMDGRKSPCFSWRFIADKVLTWKRISPSKTTALPGLTT